MLLALTFCVSFESLAIVFGTILELLRRATLTLGSLTDPAFQIPQADLKCEVDVFGLHTLIYCGLWLLQVVLLYSHLDHTIIHYQYRTYV